MLQLAWETKAQRVLLETDEPYRQFDMRVGAETARDLDIVHLRSADEPLLWLSDAVAWCVQRGKPWSELVAAVIVSDLRV